MVWFRECWHEEVLRQLRQGLTKCYQVAFETRGDGMYIGLLPVKLQDRSHARKKIAKSRGLC